MAECKSCKAKILWVKTINGKNMPVDKKPVTVFIGQPDPEDPSQSVYYMAKGYVPHWATCPSANNHRKKHEPVENKS